MHWLAHRVLDLIARTYRWVVSPAIHLLAGSGHGCRFEPTCSRYAHGAVKDFGVARGAWLTFRRVLRCHPFSRGGYDPVPCRAIGSTYTKDFFQP